MKSTLKRESKVRETDLKEAIGVSSAACMISDQPKAMGSASLLDNGGVVHSWASAGQPRFGGRERVREKVARLPSGPSGVTARAPRLLGNRTLQGAIAGP